MDRLVEHGLVEREEVGATYAYGLNRGHLLAPIIEQLAAVRISFINRVRELIADWEVQPLHASVFGSMARGDGDAASDIDFFLVRPGKVDLEDQCWRQQLDGLSVCVREWTGNPASLIEVGKVELAELRRQRLPILKEIRTDAIELAGKKAREAVGR